MASVNTQINGLIRRVEGMMDGVKQIAHLLLIWVRFISSSARVYTAHHAIREAINHKWTNTRCSSNRPKVERHDTLTYLLYSFDDAHGCEDGGADSSLG